MERDLVDDTGKRYFIKKQVGQGYTADVYEVYAEDAPNHSFAAKVMRVDVTETSRRNFWIEPDLLDQFKNAAPTNEILHVPQIYARSRNSQPEFFIIDWIDPTDYIDLAKATSKIRASMPFDPQQISEVEAIIVLNQFLEVLDLLHNKLERSYIDMQLTNFRWQRQTQQLMVLDWNHVSLPRTVFNRLQTNVNTSPAKTFDDLLHEDLIRVASFIYQVLTGMGTSWQWGEYGNNLARLGGQRWQALSIATRQLLQRALHPNPAQRFKTVTEFSAAAQSVKQLIAPNPSSAMITDWEEEFFELDRAIRKLNKPTESSDTLMIKVDIDRALALVDVLDRYYQVRNDKLFKDYKQRLWTFWGWSDEQQVLEHNRDWTLGWLAFQQGHYAKACEAWQRASEEYNRVDLWRWWHLANIANQLIDNEAKNNFEQVKNVWRAFIQALNQQKPEKAQEFWGRLPEKGLLETVFYGDLNIVTYLCAAQMNLKTGQQLDQTIQDCQKVIKAIEAQTPPYINVCVMALLDVPPAIRLSLDKTAEQKSVIQAVNDLISQLKLCKAHQTFAASLKIKVTETLDSIWQQQTDSDLNKLQGSLFTYPEASEFVIGWLKGHAENLKEVKNLDFSQTLAEEILWQMPHLNDKDYMFVRDLRDELFLEKTKIKVEQFQAELNPILYKVWQQRNDSNQQHTLLTQLELKLKAIEPEAAWHVVQDWLVKNKENLMQPNALDEAIVLVDRFQSRLPSPELSMSSGIKQISAAIVDKKNYVTCIDNFMAKTDNLNSEDKVGNLVDVFWGDLLSHNWFTQYSDLSTNYIKHFYKEFETALELENPLKGEICHAVLTKFDNLHLVS